MPKVYYDSQGQPIYDKDDWKNQDEFQKAALAEIAARKQTKQAQVANQPANPGSFASQAVDMLPAVGGSLGAMVPGMDLTGLPEVGGAAAGSIAKTMLKNKFPQTFGANPESGLSQAGDSISDTVLGSMPGLSKALSKVTAAGAKLTGTSIGKTLATHITDMIDGLHNMDHPAALDAAKDALRAGGIAIKNYVPDGSLAQHIADSLTFQK